MEQIIYLIHSRASIGRASEDDDPHNAVLMKIPLVRLSWPREGRRPLPVCGREALASSAPAAPPHLSPDGTTRAQSDSSDSRLRWGHCPTRRCHTTLTTPSPPRSAGHSSCSPFLLTLPSDFYWGGGVKWERSLPRVAHLLSLLPPGWIGIKIREFNFAAKSRFPREGLEGRKTLRSMRAKEAPPPRRPAFP